MSEKPDERIVLRGEDALQLWRQGKDAWNKWVIEHPEADIDFVGTDFSKEFRSKSNYAISFRGFIFPNGNISFAFADFGKGHVDFFQSTFGKGYVDFSCIDFGEGYVDFSQATFGEGHVDFSRTNFSEGHVYFFQTTFGEGYVDFSQATFGEGHIDFSQAIFGKGNVNFSKVAFGEGTVDFSLATFGEGHVDFSYTVFKSSVLFETLNHISRVFSFSFRHAVFDGPLEISTNHGEAFSCVPDLTGTKTTHHVSLEGLRCTFLRRHSSYIKMRNNYYPKFGIFKGDWLGQKIAADLKDAERLRRLKELAEDNKDHQKALDFHVMEMKAMRKFKPSKWWPLPLLFNSEFWFEKLGDYGRSISKPVCILFYNLLFFAGIYNLSSNTIVSSYSDFLDKVGANFILSFSQILAFMPNSRIAKEDAANILFLNGDIPIWVYFLLYAQSLFSLVLIFLIGLALKHRFKL